MIFATEQERKVLYPEEAEKIEIGKILLNHDNYFLSIQEELKPEDFYNRTYQDIYEKVRDLYIETGKVDFASVAERCGKYHGEIAMLVDQSDLYRNLSWPLKKVLSFSRRRKLHQAIIRVQKQIGAIEDEQVLFNELADIATSGRREKGKVYSGDESAHRIFERQLLRQNRKDTLDGYRTGFDLVDHHFGGLVPKRLTLLSGPSGHGKTGMAVNWLVNIAVKRKIPSLFVSLEMGVQDVEDRFLSVLTGLESRKIKSGVMDSEIDVSLQALRDSPVFISDNNPRDIHDICAMVERYAIIHGIKFWVLDYIGEIVRDEFKGKEGRDERFARWVKLLRDVSKRMDIHGVILCQVNAEGNLAESKKMAHISDGWLHFEREASMHLLECRKNRFGPAGNRYQIKYNRYNQQMVEEGIYHAD